MKTEKRILSEIQAQNGRNTRCVFMFDSVEPDSLVLEDHSTDMRQFLTRGSKVLESELLQIVESVNSLHGCEYIHGDLKPQNFLIKILPGGVVIVKVCDFDTTTKIGEYVNTSKHTTVLGDSGSISLLEK